MTLRIRDISLPQDKEAALSFIWGSQSYEHAFEPDRRMDSAVAAEFFPVVMERVAKNRGRIFIAEKDGAAIGWGVFIVEQAPLYVVEEERECGFIIELFVKESERGLGVGQALIAACEDEARRLGLALIMIGVLTENKRSADIYQRAGYAPYSLQLRKYL
jgi:GNAT superfamily N-acetyltransferase